MFDELKIRPLTAGKPDASDLRFCGFSLNVPRRLLQYRASEIPLTPKELDLLIFLLLSGARPVKRDEIIYSIWPTDDISDSALSQTVYRLRRTLAKYNPQTEYVRTIPGIGYQFVAPIGRQSPGPGMPDFSNEAFHAYRRATFHLERRTQGDARRAIALFESALRVDREYAPAIAGLARAHAVCGDLLYAPAHNAYAKAKRLAADALRLDPSSGEAYAVMSHVLLFSDRNYDAAHNAAENAISLTPFSAKARTAAVWVCIARGDTAQGLSHLSDALSVDPSSPALTALLGVVLYFARRFDEAHRYFAEALAFDPEYAPARYFDACTWAMQNGFARAEDSLNGISSDDAPWRTTALRGYLTARAGDVHRSETILGDLQKINLRSHFSEAIVLAGLRRVEEAIESLGLAVCSGESGAALASGEPLLSDVIESARGRAAELLGAQTADQCKGCGEDLHDSNDVFECSYGCTFCASCGATLDGNCIDCAERLGHFSRKRAV